MLHHFPSLSPQPPTHTWHNLYSLITFSLSFLCRKPAIMCPSLRKRYWNDWLLFLFPDTILSCPSSPKPLSLLPLMAWTLLKIAVKRNIELGWFLAWMIFNIFSTVNDKHKSVQSSLAEPVQLHSYKSVQIRIGSVYSRHVQPVHCSLMDFW